MMMPTADVRNAAAESVLHVIVSIGVVCYWRGVWVLLDQYVYPNDVQSSGWFSLGVGYSGFLLASVVTVVGRRTRRDETKEGRDKASMGERILRTIAMALYNFYLGFVCVNCWRGMWYLQDVYLFEHDAKASACISTAIGAAVLYICFHFQSVFAPPLVILSESDSGLVPFGLFKSPSTFSRMWSMRTEPESRKAAEEHSLEMPRTTVKPP